MGNLKSCVDRLRDPGSGWQIGPYDNIEPVQLGAPSRGRASFSGVITPGALPLS